MRPAAISRLAAFVAASAGLAAPAGASPAERCGASGRAVVAVRDDAPDAATRGEVFEQLRAALAERGIEACEGDAPLAVAMLDVTFPKDVEAASLTLTVRDALTKKRVARDVGLTGIPPDARALVVAQAADELLRASWAELLLVGAPKPERAVPPEVRRAVEPSSPSPAPTPAPPPAAPAGATGAPVLELGAGLAGEIFGGGHAEAGPDVVVAVFPWPRVGARARAGPRASGRDASANGEVRTTAVVAALGIVVGAVPRAGRFGLDLVPELVVTRIALDARASPGAAASSASGAAVHAAMGAFGWLVVAAPVRAGASIGLGAPLHGVRGVDGGETVVGVSGLLANAALLVAGAF